MSNYDVAVGVDLNFFDELIKKIFSKSNQENGRNSFKLNLPDLHEISCEFVEALVLDYSPSVLAKKFLKENICKDADADTKKQIIQYIENDITTMGINTPVIELNIKQTKGSESVKYSAAFNGGCLVSMDGNGNFTIQVVTGLFKLDGEPELEKILNNDFLSEFIKIVNNLLGNCLKVTAVSFNTLIFSMPVLKLMNGFLIVFSVLAEKGDTVAPASGNWPKDKLFVCFDDDIADEIMTPIINAIRKSEEAKDSIDIGICILKLDANYTIGLRNPSYRAETGHIATVSLEAFGGGNVSCKCGALDPSFGLEIGAAPHVSSAIETIGNDVNLVFKGVNKFDVNIKVKHFPKWLNKALSAILSFLLSAVSKLISSMIVGLKFKLFTLPSYSFSVLGYTITIGMGAFDVDIIQDSDNKKLTSVAGNIKIDVKK